MSTTKVMIVDDSAFSRATLTEIIQNGGFEVVAEASSIENLIDTYKNCKPDVVTMDIAMPGADGFECSKALLLHDPHARIILVSSMKDEETENEARMIGIRGYVQKPVDEDVLIKVINNIISPDTLYNTLDSWGEEVFKEALSQSITKFTKSSVSLLEKDTKVNNTTLGMTVIIGIVGKYPGKMVLDSSLEIARKMAEKVLRREVKNNDEILAMFAELANVIGGIACSMLNKKEKILSLRVTPPSIFYGESSEIIHPTMDIRNIYVETEFGNIKLSYGFKRESVLWM